MTELTSTLTARQLDALEVARDAILEDARMIDETDDGGLWEYVRAAEVVESILIVHGRVIEDAERARRLGHERVTARDVPGSGVPGK